MNEEYFDIFDENNQPLGITKTRSIVHRDLTDWHRATDIWIVDTHGNILCQKRSQFKDVHPGQWSSHFGGHLKAGETYEENAIHELREELGISVTGEDLVFINQRKSEQHKHFTNVYLLWWTWDTSELVFCDGEVEEIAWLTMDQIRQQMEAWLFCNSMNTSVVEYIENSLSV